MTWEELEKVESYLKENGYRNGGEPTHTNADHYWYKAFGKEDNPYEEGRSLWQVFINVYDWRRWIHVDSMLQDASLTVTIRVSRTVYECGIELDYDVKDDKFDLKSIEDNAYNFWRYVEESFGAPPKE